MSSYCAEVARQISTNVVRIAINEPRPESILEAVSLSGQHVGIGSCVIMTTHVHGLQTQLPIPHHVDNA